MGAAYTTMRKWAEPTPTTPTESVDSQSVIDYNAAFRRVDANFASEGRNLYNHIRMHLVNNQVYLDPRYNDLSPVHVINACVLFKNRYGGFPWQCDA
jgi:hypothetical protein